MSKNFLSLIFTVGFAAATGVWTMDPSRPDPFPPKAPRAAVSVAAPAAAPGTGLPAARHAL